MYNYHYSRYKKIRNHAQIMNFLRQILLITLSLSVEIVILRQKPNWNQKRT